MRKKIRDYSMEIGKGIWHVLTSMPGYGDFFNFSDYMLSIIFQTIKGIEENLEKLMKASDLEYIRNKEYPSPLWNYPTPFNWWPANSNAEELYKDYKKDFGTIEDMINSSEVEKAIEGRSDAYKSSYIESLRYSFEHDEGRIKRDAERKRKNVEKEKREGESALREIEIKELNNLISRSDVGIDSEPMQFEGFDISSRENEFFKGFLESIKDIQENQKEFNEKSLKELESEANEKADDMDSEFHYGYSYAIKRNKLSPEDLNYNNLGGPTSHGVYLSIVEDILKIIDEKGKDDSALEEVSENQQIRNDINEMKGNINAINESLKKMNDFIDEQRRKDEERTKKETEMKVDETETFSNEEVDNMVTLYNNFNEVSGNLITAVEILQKSVDPAAGNENILPISLSEEDKIFISTQIAEKLNEEEKIVPSENTAEGVTNEELGIEVRDSKRSLKGEIGDIKAKLDVLLKLIEKKAMTFDDIYKMVFRRLAHEYEMQTGRRIGR